MTQRDAKIEKGGGIKGMLISMCNCACEDEISEIVSSNDEIRKLRDALNKYLESWILLAKSGKMHKIKLGWLWSQPNYNLYAKTLAGLC